LFEKRKKLHGTVVSFGNFMSSSSSSASPTPSSSSSSSALPVIMRPTRPSQRLAPPVGKPSNEEILRLVADYNVVAQRVTEMANESNSSRGSYVSSLRSTVSAESEVVPDSKIVALERVLMKIADLDRLVLLKTAPEETQPAGGRRNSKSIELASLPTHLFIINRLLDLHAEAKRVTVVRTHTVIGGGASNGATEAERPESPRSNRDKKVIETLNTTVSRLNKQIEESGQKLSAAQQEVINLQTQNGNLKDELDKINSKQKLDDEKLAKLDEANSSLEKSKKAIETLKKELDAALQAKTAVAPVPAVAVQPPTPAVAVDTTIINDYEKLIAVLQSLKTGIDSKTMDSFPQSHADSLEQKSKTAVQGVVESIRKFMQQTQNEINLLLAARDHLESELATNTVQRDILNNDLNSVASELEAMKCAYNSIESECVDLRRKIDIDRGNKQESSKSSVNAEELLATQQRLAVTTDLLQQLQDDLAVTTNRNLELEKYPNIVSSLDGRIIALEAERAQLKATITGLTNEVDSYKRLTESLKDKLKSSSVSSDKDFLDTFEEVMRDEMATMKSAFEAKLRAAREESDQLTRKHSQEILRLHQSNSPNSKYGTTSSSSSSASRGLKMTASNVLNFRDK
jgi:chromosome segregation ATPase